MSQRPGAGMGFWGLHVGWMKGLWLKCVDSVCAGLCKPCLTQLHESESGLQSARLSLCSLCAQLYCREREG